MSGFRRAFMKGAASSILESGGTVLPLGAVADGSALVRSGSALIGTIAAFGYATTSTSIVKLSNTTPATVGATVQYSPAIELLGTAWKSNATAESQTNGWKIENRPVTGAAVTTSALHFLASIAGGAYASKASLANNGTLTANNVNGSGQLSAGSAMVGNYEDVGIGLGAVYNWRIGAGATNAAFGFAHNARTDAANAIVFFQCYNCNAASITNAATMRLSSFGWTNDSDVYTELGSVRCDGSLYAVSMRASGNLGGVASHVTITNATEASAGAATGNYLVIYDGTTKLKLALLADS